MNTATIGARSAARRTYKAARVRYARSWHFASRMRVRLSQTIIRHSGLATFTVLIGIIGLSTYWFPVIHDFLAPHFETSAALDDFRSLILTVGGALIAATAITFSLIMFAMQVNIERLPHGLFRRLSADGGLLGAFTATFVLAIIVAALSLIPQDTFWITGTVYGAVWGTVIILILFLIAFRRALSLINPVQQLRLVVQGAQTDLRRWGRRAQRASPLLEVPNDQNDSDSDGGSFQSTHDMSRVAYFRLNPNWINEARRAVTHSVTFARRYAEQTDYEVTAAALTAIVQINAAYIEAKGKTFFTRHLLFDNPLSTDAFINDTLEDLRQSVRTGLRRGDERQVEQILQTYKLLCQLYLRIDYANALAAKTHAHLAAGYLNGAADEICPHNMPDVLMEWARYAGQCAQLFIAHAGPNDIATFAEKIGSIAASCMTTEAYRPVTLVGMEQLTRLSYALISSHHHNIHFALGILKKNVLFVTKIALALPDTPTSNIQQTYLAPYYSGTSTTTLLQWLTDLVNTISEAPADDDRTSDVIRNIEQWAEDLHQEEKEIFLLAIQKESLFVIDLIHWYAHVTRLLIALSNAPACNDHMRDELRQHALWLIYVLDWVPDSGEAVTFVENCDLTETIFEAALDAYQRNCEEISEELSKMLLNWGFKAGKHQTAWHVLPHALCGLATFALLRGGAARNDQLKNDISGRLAGGNIPSQELSDRTAREVRHKAATLGRREFDISTIEHAMGQVDHQQLVSLLGDIANILSPGTANEQVQDPIF